MAVEHGYYINSLFHQFPSPPIEHTYAHEDLHPLQPRDVSEKHVLSCYDDISHEELTPHPHPYNASSQEAPSIPAAMDVYIALPDTTAVPETPVPEAEAVLV